MKDQIKRILKKSKILVKIKRRIFNNNQTIRNINYANIDYYRNEKDLRIVVDSNDDKVERYGLICKKNNFSNNFTYIDNIESASNYKKTYFLKEFDANEEELNYIKSYILSKRKADKIVLVGHSGGQGGAEVLLENIAKEMVDQGIDIVILTRGNGPIIEKYRNIAPTYVMDTVENTLMAIENMSKLGYKKVVLNTIVNGDLIPHFKNYGFQVITLVHELPGVIKILGCEDRAKLIATESDYVVFPSNFVCNKFETIQKVITKKIIKPQGLYMKYSEYNRKKGKAAFCEKYGIPTKNLIVMNAGVGEYRKGIDLFLTVAEKLKDNNITFVWVGTIADEYSKDKRLKLNNLITPGFITKKEDFVRFYEASDIFLLTSREDPFPSVILEAFNASLPVIAFENAGGFQDIVKNNISGFLVEYENVDEMVNKILLLKKETAERKKLGIGAKKISDKHNFKDYISTLIKLFRKE